MESFRKTVLRVVLGPSTEQWDDNEQRGIAGTKSVELYGMTVPLGVVMIAATGDSEGWWQVSYPLLLCIVAISVATLGYACQRIYGEPPTSLRWADVGFLEANLRDIPKAVACVAGLLAYGVLLAMSGLTDIYHQPAVSTTGFCLALGILLWHLWVGTYQEDPVQTGFTAKFRRRMLSSHYLLMGVLVAFVSLVPLSGLLPSWRLFADSTVFGLVTGTIMIVGGVLDRKLLRRLSKPIPASQEES